MAKPFKCVYSCTNIVPVAVVFFSDRSHVGYEIRKYNLFFHSNDPVLLRMPCSPLLYDKFVAEFNPNICSKHERK